MESTASRPARDLDLRPLLARLRSRWPVLALAFVIGGAIGYASGVRAGQVFRAGAVLYIPQDLGPGGKPVQSLASQPSALSAIVRGDANLARVARVTRLPLSELRSGVSAAPLGGVPSANATGPQTSLFTITVKGSRRRPVAAATRLLADELHARVSAYSTAEIGQLRAQLASLSRTLAAVRAARVPKTGTAAGAALAQVLADEQNALVRQRTTVRLELATFTSVRPKVLSVSRAAVVSARTPRSSAVVGALIGLILAAALVLLPLERRWGNVASAPAAARGPARVRTPAGWWEVVGVEERPSRRELVFLALLGVGLGVIFAGGLAAAVSLIRPTVFFGLLALGLLALLGSYVVAGADNAS